MATRTLTVRGLPVDTLKRLRARAESNRRSLNGEILTILERATAAEALRDDSGPDSATGPAAALVLWRIASEDVEPVIAALERALAGS